MGEEKRGEERRGGVYTGLDKQQVKTRNERKRREGGGWTGHMDVGRN